ncbi:DNA (cytosine-5)-methyltransferase 3-like isoform X3 [Pteropus alecto]|uniref:DNA (cytosine-5)-methyltransferase 3-like isoform X3 n=1 Tax=Pteropus alecto TaxID=9402 RepID=UPI000D53AE98|nr:DNA (cytosine-5)-methyltransferase 3-like isoform X3 [Pteropus alecto]
MCRGSLGGAGQGAPGAAQHSPQRGPTWDPAGIGPCRTVAGGQPRSGEMRGVLVATHAARRPEPSKRPNLLCVLLKCQGQPRRLRQCCPERGYPVPHPRNKVRELSCEAPMEKLPASAGPSKAPSCRLALWPRRKCLRMTHQHPARPRAPHDREEEGQGAPSRGLGLSRCRDSARPSQAEGLGCGSSGRGGGSRERAEAEGALCRPWVPAGAPQLCSSSGRSPVEQWGPFDLVYGATPPFSQACDRPPGWYLFQFHRVLQYARPGGPRPFFWMFVDNLVLTEDDRAVASRFLEVASWPPAEVVPAPAPALCFLGLRERPPAALHHRLSRAVLANACPQRPVAPGCVSHRLTGFRVHTGSCCCRHVDVGPAALLHDPAVSCCLRWILLELQAFEQIVRR